MAEVKVTPITGKGAVEFTKERYGVKGERTIRTQVHLYGIYRENEHELKFNALMRSTNGGEWTYVVFDLTFPEGLEDKRQIVVSNLVKDAISRHLPAVPPAPPKPEKAEEKAKAKPAEAEKPKADKARA